MLLNAAPSTRVSIRIRDPYSLFAVEPRSEATKLWHAVRYDIILRLSGFEVHITLPWSCEAIRVSVYCIIPYSFLGLYFQTLIRALRPIFMMRASLSMTLGLVHVRYSARF